MIFRSVIFVNGQLDGGRNYAIFSLKIKDTGKKELQIRIVSHVIDAFRYCVASQHNSLAETPTATLWRATEKRQSW